MLREAHGVSMEVVDNILLEAIKLAHLPYIWGGNNPDDDLGLDCSGFIGYIFRLTGVLPEGYDNTAQGYYDKYKQFGVNEYYGGCLAFYGKKPTKVSHIMLVVNDKACIGALRGNRWTDTIERAKVRKARIDVRPIKYRKDFLMVADPLLDV